MAVLNAVVIGLGGRAKTHLAVVLKLSNRFRLVGVCDIDGERTRTVALEVGANAYTGLEEMLDKEVPDVGLIAVQAEIHGVDILSVKSRHLAQTYSLPGRLLELVLYGRVLKT